MRGVFSAVIVVATFLSAGSIFAGSDQISCSVNGKQIAGRDACLAALSSPSKTASSLTQKKKDSVARSSPIATQLTPKMPAVVAIEQPAPEVKVFLRKSMDDLKSLSQPSDLSDATGALFSWTDDRVGANRNFTAQALIGASVSGSYLPRGSAYLSETFTGAYFQIDRQLNSKDVKTNVDDITFGGRHEFVIANAASTSHYIGIAGEIVADSYGVAKNWNATVDYQPFGVKPDRGERPLISYANWPFDNIKYVFVTFSPKLQAEYRGSLDGNSDPIFKYHNSVFRLGGSMGVNVAPNIFYSSADMPFIISRSVVNVSYGWLYDALSDRQFGYLDAAYTFNLTETGDVGISFNYRHGKLQTTAQDVDLYKIALSAKFDYAPPGVFK